MLERTVSLAARIDIEIFGLGSTSKSCNSLWSEVPRHLLTEKGILLMWDNACPSRSAAATCPSSERGTMTSATPQINFPYMSDACTPAMDVQMAAQGEGMPRSFWPSLSVLLNGSDGYRQSGASLCTSPNAFMCSHLCSTIEANHRMFRVDPSYSDP